MVRILNGLVAPTFVPVGVAAIAHEAADIVGAVLRGRSRLAKLAHYAEKDERCVSTVVVAVKAWSERCYFIVRTGKQKQTSSSEETDAVSGMYCKNGA